MFASATPVIRFVAPGPRVDRHPLDEKVRKLDPRSARESSVHVGHERRALLVARGDEADRAVEQDVHHVDVLLARDAEDGAEPGVVHISGRSRAASDEKLSS